MFESLDNRQLVQLDLKFIIRRRRYPANCEAFTVYNKLFKLLFEQDYI